VPERLDDVEHRYREVEDDGSDGQEGADDGGAGLDPVFAHGISLREPAGPADVDLEEVE